jgi:hypothetical protein
VAGSLKTPASKPLLSCVGQSGSNKTSASGSVKAPAFKPLCVGQSPASPSHASCSPREQGCGPRPSYYHGNSGVSCLFGNTPCLTWVVYFYCVEFQSHGATCPNTDSRALTIRIHGRWYETWSSCFPITNPAWSVRPNSTAVCFGGTVRRHALRLHAPLDSEHLHM